MATTGIDNLGVFYSDTLNGTLNAVNPDTNPDAANQQRRTQIEQKFKDFLRKFHITTANGGVVYPYRDGIKRNYNNKIFSIKIHLGDLKIFDRVAWDAIKNEPREFIDIFEDVATFVADEVTRPRPFEEEDIEQMQVILTDDALATSLRDLKADTVAKLTKIPGIVVNASSVRIKAKELTLQCRSCGYLMPNVQIPSGLDGYAMPRSCPNKENQTKSETCPLDPFTILPDKAKYINFQTLKIQEAPDFVPQGEMQHFSKIK